MKLFVFSLALLLSTGLVSAAPNPVAGGSKSKGPPGPPSKSFGSLKQSCSAKQSSIRCCNQTKNGKSSHKVNYGGESYDLQCNQIT
ncbi:hypothetical protein MMC16_003028, partial [Acarospora aff. strigata]|nr:hypothetical protein [Acarospora aff. strigata]